MQEKDFHIPPKEKLESLYNEAVPALTEVLDRLTELIRSAAQERGLYVTIRSRVKKFSSWHAKFLRSIRPGMDWSQELSITDILGVRVICPFLEEVSLISKMMQELFIIEEHDIKGADYPYQHFGYESVHFLVAIPVITPSLHSPVHDFLKLTVCEIQVRTILQEAWAEVEHELIYKSNFSPLDEPLKRKLAALNANLTLSDIMFQEIRDYQRVLHKALRERRKTFYNSISRTPEDDQESVSYVNNTNNQQSGFLRETVDALLLKGLLAHNEERYHDAIEIYSNILLGDISSEIRSIILLHRGMAYFSSNLHNEALSDFNQAIELNPGQLKARHYRAVHERVNKKFTEALADHEECIKAEPYNLEYLTARAETRAAAGEPGIAIEECRIILRLDPDFKPALRLLEILSSNN